eukprot:840647-Rhodomonas_salina.1
MLLCDARYDLRPTVLPGPVTSVDSPKASRALTAGAVCLLVCPRYPLSGAGSVYRDVVRGGLSGNSVC